MVKLRYANYCNLKFFLIFLVIYGHLIEPRIWESDILMTQYRWIYLIHMPLFSFLSGLFVNKEKDCGLQLIRILPLYLFLQMVAVLFGNGAVKFLTPWWILWYLLSYSIWLCFTWLWFRFCKGKFKILLLICSIVIGCMAGLFPSVGREFSLSRTLVFFPYFFAGVIMHPAYNWKKLRIAGIIAFIVAFGIILYIGDNVPVTFLYQASPYVSKKEILLRLLCYFLGGALGLFSLTITPNIRLPFSKIGTNTMPACLLHAPIVIGLRWLVIPWQYHIIIAIAFLCIMYVLTKWHGTLYGIISTERRDNSWQPFKKSTKSVLNRSIDSYYP